MLKIIFPVLLLANAGLFAYRHGGLEGLVPSGREPTRIENQLNPERLKLVPPPATAADPAPEPAPPADAAPSAQAPSALTAVAARAPEVVACAEIGDFDAEEAKRFASRLAPLALGERLARRQLQEVSSHIVYIPPQPDKEAVERKVAELRGLGIQDFFVILDNSPLRWGISLGVFKQESAARTHLAQLAAKGVRSARIGQRTAPNGLVAFQLRKLDAPAKSELDRIRADFARQQLRGCA